MQHRFLLNSGLIALTAAAFALSAAGARAADPAPPAASVAPAAPAPLAGNHYQGSVTSVDATAKTFVIDNRFSGTPLTVTTDTDTKVKAIKNIGMEDLKVGDKLIAQGQVSPDQTTVTARQIRLLPADAKGKMKVTVRSASGTVATTTPALTITTEDGKTMTVTTEERTRVMAAKDAEFGDIAVGNQVEVMGAADGTSFHATSVMITSPKARHRKGAGTVAPPADTTEAPAADATPVAPAKPAPDPLAKP